ncbi:MAG: 16S rRNA (guanine(966)-N(2))-methyltransferase RsmD [Rickettsiales bacterium]|nr:16S rRNA (guanine(966)-N(2))-methyltransferase RsmD [Rickettsiales bacterium]
MRIVAGKFRGKNLAKSDHLKLLRPTTDKNREALFNILASAKFVKEINFKIEGAKVLDVCCGSGAVGFEALSRGAASISFIDNNLQHLELVKKNAALLQVENEIKIFCADVKNLPQKPNAIFRQAQDNNEFFDLIFIDPPYAEDYKTIIENLLQKNWLKKDSLIVIEFQTNSRLKNFLLNDFTMLDSRSYGKTSFVFLTYLT